MKPILTAMIAIPTSIPSKGNMPTNNRRRLIGGSLPLASLPFPSSMFVTKGAPLWFMCLLRYPALRIRHREEPLLMGMDLTTLDYIRISIGAVILLYVANCLVNQRVWIRKTFSWGAREEYPKIFQMNIIGGSLIGLFLAAGPFLFWNIPYPCDWK